jgi:hypothetical protein
MSNSASVPSSPKPSAAETNLHAGDVIPTINSKLQVPTILGNGALFNFGVNGGDLAKVSLFYEEELRKKPGEAAFQLDLALLHLLQGRKDEAYRVQALALARQQLFRVVGTAGKVVPVRRRVLAFVAPGDFTNNAQIEFILDGGDMGLDLLYLVPGQPLPAKLPEHDVAFCAVNESDENLPVLERLAGLVPRWPRPVLNAPEKISRVSRNGVATLMRGAPSVCAPAVGRVTAPELYAAAAGAVELCKLLPEVAYPILVRPVGSHGGKNLAKIDNGVALSSYLGRLVSGVTEFFITPFVDYRSADGFFRKYRIVFFEGKPFLCHLALSTNWMIHYIKAGMSEDETKREVEARAMETFKTDFAHRHRVALAEIAARLGLDYFVIDCGELPDGRLLLFEADIAMVIHSIDSPTVFPYKHVHMAKVFDAFRAMIDRAASRPPGLA